MKRYYEFVDGDGVTYIVVATDEAAAIRALDGVEFGVPSAPFAQALDADGHPLKMSEIDPGKAATIMVNTSEDGRGRGSIPLTECDLCEWFSTEY